ncbi:MAG: AgmX/PglI C-terminal domain-containing protein [Pseudomonadota bacterium]
MKFSCESCGTTYNLPDDRVAGKILKIRCRRCEHINTVDGSLLSSEEAAPAEASPAPPPPVFPSAPAPATAPGPAAKALPFSDTAADPSLEAMRKGTLSLSLADLPPEVRGEGHVVSMNADLDSVAADASALQAAPPQVSPLAEVSTPDLDAPPDSTRMAIEQAGMAHRAAKHRLYAMVAILVFVAVAGLLTLDALGIIVIPVVHTAVVAAKQAVGVESRPAKQPWVSVLTDEEREAIRKALLTGNQVEAQRIRKVARTRAKQKGLDIDLSDQVSGSGVTMDDLVRREQTGSTAVDLSAEQAAMMADLMKRDDKVPTQIQINPSLPDIRMPTRTEGGLTEKQIGKVVGENQGGIQYCATQETKRGLKLPPKLNLVVTVVGYGKVTAARIDDTEHKQSPLGKCLVNKARIWQFPQFTGDPMDIEIPLKFTTVN